MNSKLMIGLNDISDEIASLPWNSKHRAYIRRLRLIRLTSCIDQLDDNNILSLPPSLIRYTLSTTLSRSIKPDCEQLQSLYHNLNSQYELSLLSKNKRIKFNSDKDMDKICESKSNLIEKLPVTIISSIFTFLEPAIVLGRCYLVNRYFQSISSIPTSYSYFESNNDEGYSNLGTLVPTLLSYIPCLIINYESKIHDVILKYISNQSNQHLKSLRICLRFPNINTLIFSITSLLKLTIETFGDQFSMNIFECHPSLTEISFTGINQVVHDSKKIFKISPLIERLFLRSRCLLLTDKTNYPTLDISNAIKLRELNAFDYNIIGISSLHTQLTSLGIEQIHDNLPITTHSASLLTDLYMYQPCDLNSLLPIEKDSLITLPRSTIFSKPLYPNLKKLIVSIQDHLHGNMICKTIINECPHLWKRLVLINGSNTFKSFSLPINNNNNISTGYLCYTSTCILLCSSIDNCPLESVIINVQISEPLYSLLIHYINTKQKFKENKMDGSRGIILKYNQVTLSIKEPGLVDSSEILFLNQSQITARELFENWIFGNKISR